jgi:transposase
MLVMAHPPAAPLAVSPSERDVLERLVRARTTEQRVAQRARIVLGAADGVANKRIAAKLGVTLMTVLLWRRRFKTDRLAGLDDAPRSGHPLVYGRGERDRIIALTLEPTTDGTTHWSARRMAARIGASITTVQRIWAEAGLKPHRTETFKFSTDPALEAKVGDVVGLYLAPPERAIVLSLDEKTGIQALDRKAPMLPLKPGQVERHTHDYKRNGTTSLFAALEAATDKVTTEARARHTGPTSSPSSDTSSGPTPQASSMSSSTTSAPTRARHPRLARTASSDHLPLLPDLGVLDEPVRDLVRDPLPWGDPARQLRFGQGAHRGDQPVCRQLERRGQPLRLGQDRGRDPRQGAWRAMWTVGLDQISCGRLQ